MYHVGLHSGKSVHKLNAMLVDLDYYKINAFKDLNAEQIIGLLEQELDYLTPSYYIDSGRGLYIIWLLEDTYVTRKSKSYWTKIEKTLIEVFKNFGADEKVHDVARVIRIIGSVNSKTGKEVRVIESPYLLNGSVAKRYEMGDIAEYFWGSRELFYDNKTKEKKQVKKSKKRKQTKKIIQIKNTYTLHWNRCRDLEKLVDMRKNKAEEGWREYLLFLYRLNLLYSNESSEKALEMVLELNSKLAIPLDDNEVIKATENAEGVSKVYHRLTQNYKETYDISLNQHLYNGGAYIYTNKAIIKHLQITEEEQKSLTTIIGTEEKKCRKNKQNKIYYKQNKDIFDKYYQENKEDISIKNKMIYQEKLKTEGKLSRKEKTELIRIEVKYLLKQGLSQRQIAKKLSMSVGAINKYVKLIKSEQE